MTIEHCDKRSIRKWLGIILLISLASGSAFAVDLGSLGFTVDSEESEGNRTVYQASDASGNQFTVTTTGDISDSEGAIITRVVNEFNGWSSLDVSYLRVTLDGGIAVALVIPSRLTYEGKDLTPYLPSGMQFYIGRIIEYDFRIRVENIFVRLRGQLSEENSFIERLNAAIEDPTGFIERNDPDYVLRELRDIDDTLINLALADEDIGTRIDKSIADIGEQIGDITEDLENEIVNLTENTRLVDDAIRADLAQTVSALERLASDIQATYLEAVDVFRDFEAEYFATKALGIEIAEDYMATKEAYLLLEERFAALTEEIEATNAANEALFGSQADLGVSLQDQIAQLRYGFVALANKSLFGKLRPVSPEDSARALVLYDEDNSRTSSDIADTMNGEGTEINSKSIAWVLLAYRGVIEE